MDEALCEKYGVTPRQLIDVKSLMGIMGQHSQRGRRGKNCPGADGQFKTLEGHANIGRRGIRQSVRES
ncbi:MAG: hypothetical protein ACLRWF_09305 [Ruthenibacterium sp.]